MGTYNLLPNGDDRNDGWSLVGSGVTKLWHAWDDDDDTTYAKSPASKGIGAVSYPDDISIPEGAVITSVTVFARANRTGSTARSLTVQLLCNEHHHHHHSEDDDDDDD